jgi:hypothetical protein
VAFQDGGQLAGRDEHVPVVERHIGEPGQPPLLRCLDREQLARAGAVNGVEQVQPAGLEHPGRLTDHAVHVRYVLEHITAARHGEGCVRHRQLLADPDPVVDAQAPPGRVGARRADRRRRRVDPGHPAAQGRELLGQEPAAAADVQHPQSGRSGTELPGEHVTEIGEPARRDAAVQHVQRARLIPPRPAQPVVHAIVNAPPHHGVLPGGTPRGFPVQHIGNCGVVARRPIRPAVARMVMASRSPTAAVAVSGIV